MFGSKPNDEPSRDEESWRLDGLPSEQLYHDTDVFGREDDHDVGGFQFSYPVERDLGYSAKFSYYPLHWHCPTPVLYHKPSPKDAQP